jgi:hypothetical protein
MVKESESPHRRRVGRLAFFKNRPYRTTSAMALLRTVQLEPGASNRRLATLTGLGVTKDDENDGVLPTFLSYLTAMDLIAPGSREGLRFVLTDIGSKILEFDPHAGGRGTLALMALLLSEPCRGAHLFDWTVRGVLSHLRPFPIGELEQEVEKHATKEGYGASRGANYDVVMRAFTDPAAFGSVSPWSSCSKGSYVLQPSTDLELPLFWSAAFMIVRGWTQVFPNTVEATLRDVRRELFVLPRGVLGIGGRTEEQFINGLQREGIITNSAVTMERLTMEAQQSDLLGILIRALQS